MSAVEPIMAAVGATLVADATLVAMLAEDIRIPGDPAILNDAKKEQPYPYVLISHADEHPWHTIGGATSGRGWNVTLLVHVYSQAHSDKEANLIRARIVELLNFQPLAVAGYTTAIVEYKRGQLKTQDIDKVKTRHIPAEFDIKVHE